MNSKALPFLIIAGLVLAGAVVWNFMSTDNEIPKVSNDASKIEKVVETKPEPKKEIIAEDIVIEDYDEPLVDIPQTEEEVKAQREKASNHMSYALRYQTAEQAVNGLKTLKNNGNEKAFNDLLEFIQSVYPNASIPAELLD